MVGIFQVSELIERQTLTAFEKYGGLHTKFGIPAESLLKQSINKTPSSSTKRS